MKEIILKVEGMVCEGCENRIKNALKNMEGVQTVFANYKKGIVTITMNEIDIKKVKEKIEDIGFNVL